MEKELYLIGNFKMNMTKSTIVPYFKTIKKMVKGNNNHVGVCVPYVYLPLAQKYLGKSNVLYGAENVHYLEKGAYTGEVSGEMLKSIGVEYVIIGHSERRQYFNETDETVNKKLKKALDVGLKPIVCVGENLSERENGTAK
jgi:triosephosphate isomerase